MFKITYQGQTYRCNEGEALLDAFLRQGVQIAFSCRKGICHVCMHACVSGPIPAAAQSDLPPELRERGYFLPCRCRPEGDMAITRVGTAATSPRAKVRSPAAKPLSPDPEMWAALAEGDLLRRILQDFYRRVYEDERLAPFFHGITKERSIEKQFLFMRQLFTGEKVYFGDRPRNAHHWMVISDELFDYREALMAECLHRAGLTEALTGRWLALEEQYRADIVKSEPWKRKVGDVELPLEGFGETVMDVGTLCDGCGAEIAAGTAVHYHLRLGSTYCRRCRDGHNDDRR